MGDANYESAGAENLLVDCSDWMRNNGPAGFTGHEASSAAGWLE